MSITAERLRQMLHYDPLTGVFIWAVSRRSPDAQRGMVAGSIDRRGYRRIRADLRRYFAHRLAWLYVTGEWPKQQIDHRNGDPGDNRWTNLREATQQQNAWNTRAANVLGIKGVRAVKSGRFAAVIQVDRKQRYLGTFDTLSAAQDAYMRVARETRGEFVLAAR